MSSSSGLALVKVVKSHSSDVNCQQLCLTFILFCLLPFQDLEHRIFKIQHCGSSPVLNNTTAATMSSSSGLALVKVVKSHSSDVNCCAFSTTLLASCAGDKTVRLFNLKTFEELPFSPLLGHSYYVHWCCFSPFGTILASCSTDGKIILWDTKTGLTLSVFEHPSKCIIRVCVFSPDSAVLLSGGTDNCLCLWNVTGKSLIR